MIFLRMGQVSHENFFFEILILCLTGDVKLILGQNDYANSRDRNRRSVDGRL